MRLLIVSQYFWPEGFRINDVVKSLRATGVDTHVMTGKPNYPQGVVYPGYTQWGCQRESREGTPVLRVPLVARGQSRWRLALNYLSFIVSGSLFGPWKLRKEHFDVIFVYAPSPVLQAIPAIFLGWLHRAPVVLWVQDLWPASLSATGHVKNRLIVRAVESLVRYIYRHVDLLLVQSEAFVAPVQQLAGGTPVKYYPNSGDASFGEPSTLSLPIVSGLDAPFPVLFAGNIGTAQAVGVIVEAAELLKDHPDIQFVVVGDGSRREWVLEQKQERRLDNLHLPGRFGVELMPGMMQRAGALLMTLADQEIFRLTVPSKLQAYLAAGRPILASLDGAGARLVEQAGAGLASPAEDGKALAAAVLKLYRMPAAVRDEMGARGSAFFHSHFAHDMLVARLVEHLQNCINDLQRGT